jgi:hypothetical protein
MDKNFFLHMLIVGAGTMLAFVLAGLAVKYRSFITATVKNEVAQGILNRLGEFVFATVGELNQTVVTQLKASGQWNAAEAAKIKAVALDKVRSFLGPEGVKTALEILGITNEKLQELISAFIEAQVGSVKAEAKLAA